MSSDAQLYFDNFQVTTLDHAKYDRVGRITATSGDNHTHITLDINTDLYKLTPGDQIELALVSTLNLDGTKDTADGKGWRDPGAGGESTLADMWDYCMFGKVYRFEEGGDGEIMYVWLSPYGATLSHMEGANVRIEK